MVYDFLMKVNTRPEKAPAIREELPFNLGDIRAAIPPHLFKANVATSWYYIARDFALFAVIAAATNICLSLTDNTWARVAIWTAYAVTQGMVGFGLWVIGHECGHQAFFGDGHALNDPVGFVLHSLYCDPYHAWRITHATHHRYTNNKELDTAFPPKDYPVAMYDWGEMFPPLHLIYVLMYVIIGWPMYICGNLEGHRYENFQNHFDPQAPMFQKKDRWDIIASDFGVFIMLGVLGYCASVFGLSNVALWYGLAWVGTHSWLVIVTFLQHSDSRVPHYEEDDNFNFVKGAIATVDRDYGWIANHAMHHITDAHVVHHIFSRVPFYRALEMTPYVAKFLGPKYYVKDERNLARQFWDAWWSHQSSFFESKAWQAANPGCTAKNMKKVGA